MVRALLEEIIPRFGVPGSLQIDNGPGFVSHMTKGITRALGIKWTLHSTWRPQSSGKVERFNQTLKGALANLRQETRENWIKLFLIALLCLTLVPRDKLKLSEFELTYGRPIP